MSKQGRPDWDNRHRVAGANWRSLDRQGRRDLIRRARAGEREAVDALVPALAWLVEGMAAKLTNDPHEREDLEQVGWVQVMKCLQLWNPAHAADADFSTYLFYPLGQFMKRELRSLRAKVKIPSQLQGPVEKLANLPEVQRQLLTGTTIELDYSGDTGRSYEAIISCDDPRPEDVIVARELEDAFDAAFAVLIEPERTIIRLRRAGQSLSDVGRRLGISKERVRQLEARGLRTVWTKLGFDEPPKGLHAITPSKSGPRGKYKSRKKQ